MSSNNPERLKRNNREKTRGLLAMLAVGSLYGVAVTNSEAYMAHFDGERYMKYKNYEQCDPRLETLDIEQDAKLRALDDCMNTERGAVALVAYGMSQSQADKYAAASTELIADAFDGLRSPTVRAVLADNETVDAFLTKNPDNCVDLNVEADYLSAVADETMNLSGYDKVISIAPMKNCDTNTAVAGVTHMHASARYAHVIEAAPIGNPVSFASDINAIAHEYGHTQHLGHAGSFSGAPAMYIYDHDSILPDTINLTDILKYNYAEYEDRDNIMGSATESRGRIMSAAQVRQLNLPEIMLGRKPDTRRYITEQGVYIEKPTSKEHTYAVLPLKDILTMHVPDSEKTGAPKSVSFDQLVVEIVFFDNGSAGTTRVSLVNSRDATTALLGEIYRKADHRTGAAYVQLENQSVKLVTDNGGVWVYDTTGSGSVDQEQVSVPEKQLLQQPK